MDAALDKLTAMVEKTMQDFKYLAAKAKETPKDVKEKEATAKDEKGGDSTNEPSAKNDANESFEKPGPAPLIGRSSLREALASDE